MKIGIITHHYVKNYGAYLQARALMSTIEKLNTNAEVSIVNYIEKKHWYKNILHILHFRKGKDNIKSYYEKIKQLFMFVKFENSLLHSNRVNSVAQIEALGYDLIIAGSDEIWNFHGSGYNPLKFGYGFTKSTRLVSYAPSVGSVTENSKIPEKVISGLLNIKMLSARDTETQNFIRRAIDKKAEKVLDPTFLYDFDSDIDKFRIKPLGYKYILIYDCKLTKNQISELKKFALINGLKIIGGGDYMEYYDDIKVCLTPYEWVSLFRNAVKVVTGTFHGTVFSIKYKKDFVAYPTEKNRINKVTSLLQDNNLKNRLLFVGDEEKLIELLSEKINYNVVYQQLDKRKEESILFLQQALKCR